MGLCFTVSYVGNLVCIYKYSKGTVRYRHFGQTVTDMITEKNPDTFALPSNENKEYDNKMGKKCDLVDVLLPLFQRY